MLIFNYFSDLLVCFFVSVNEVYNDIICLGQISEYKVLEVVTETWNMSKFWQHTQVWIGDNIRSDKLPVV